MDNVYDYFSVDDAFWFQFKSHLFTFGTKMLPKGIHLTISFHPNNTRVNFHVTNNKGDQANKPKITIVEIEKATLAQVSESLIKKMLGSMYKPFDFRQFTLDNRNKVGFISFTSIQESEYGKQMEEGIKNALLPITTFSRKTRVKLKGDIVGQLRGLLETKQQLKQLEKQIVVVRHIPKGDLSGILISKRGSKVVMRVNDRWLEFKPLENLNEFLQLVLGKEHAETLMTRYKNAIKIVLKAKTYQEVEKYDKPPLLYLKTQSKDQAS